MKTKIIAALAIFFISQALAQPPCMKGEGGPGSEGGMPPCAKHGDGPGFSGKDFINPYMLSELGLDDGQNEALREFRTKMQKEMIDLKGEIAKVEVDLKDEFTNYPLDMSKIENLKKRITTLKAQLIGNRIDGMIFLHSQLSREQHEKLIQLREERTSNRHSLWKDRKGGGRKGPQ